MSFRLRCDGPQCDKETNQENPMWFTLTTGDRRQFTRTKTWHYCSPGCAHKHTYLLISGDNGK